jgi:hypothetical protein
MLDQLQSALPYFPYVAAAVVCLYLRHYIAEKAKNLATVEDTRAITRAVEEVRAEQAQKLERLRSELVTQVNASSFRYQREFEILTELSSRAIQLARAANSLRPMLDSHDPKESEEDRTKRRLESFNDASWALRSFISERRPFFAEHVYEAAMALDSLTYSEAVEYQMAREFPPGSNERRDYWKNARANATQIKVLVDDLILKIRQRVREWEPIVERSTGSPTA